MEREVQNTYSYIKLIKEIERFPVLYNYSLQDYSNKTVTDKSWAEIAKKTNSTVGECKEKWRNIRSSFLRSRKAPQNGSRPKKVYYLAEHLAFILPFLKCRDTSHREDEEQESIGESDTQSQDCNFEVEKCEVDDFEGMKKEVDERTFFTEPSIINVVSRKRHISEDETIDYVKRKYNPEAAKSTHPMHYFFLSLFDEFDTMDERQIRQFKIRVLQVIDDIKTSKVTQPFGVSVSPEPSHVAFQIPI
ncbi:transcription factor Adf-1-like [Cydia pomonella]|uniref:transcription factor Adf-1-like n=1 Tax=Cydia pomonella TaxID=82600 RepID=UPI002ADDD152|nr:transcription factor Adf-1-like [Cydia pomonella]